MLKNKMVLITGASSGIGAATARIFAQAGAKLLLCARRINLVKELANELEEKFSTRCFAFPLDVTDYSQVKKHISELPEEWQGVDILINNAGLALGFDPVQNADVEDWEKMIDTNVKGLLYVTRQILPRMVEKNYGHIINLGSIAGHQVYPKGVIYCATKHSVKAISEGLRLDLLGTKIRVTSIDPGAVETDFSFVRFKGDEKRAQAVYQDFTPLKAEDIAETIFYCANRPAHVNISEMLIMPTDQASAHLISRK